MFVTGASYFPKQKKKKLNYDVMLEKCDVSIRGDFGFRRDVQEHCRLYQGTMVGP